MSTEKAATCILNLNCMSTSHHWCFLMHPCCILLALSKSQFGPSLCCESSNLTVPKYWRAAAGTNMRRQIVPRKGRCWCWHHLTTHLIWVRRYFMPSKLNAIWPLQKYNKLIIRHNANTCNFCKRLIQVNCNVNLIRLNIPHCNRRYSNLRFILHLDMVTVIVFLGPNRAL